MKTNKDLIIEPNAAIEGEVQEESHVLQVLLLVGRQKEGM